MSPTSSPVTLAAPIKNADGTPITSPRTVKYVVHVSNSAGSGNSAIVSVTVNAAVPGPLPIVKTINPKSGTAGIVVTIKGKNFGAAQGSGFVNFGALQASVRSWSNAEIIVVAPSGLPGKIPVGVTTSTGTSNTKDFTYLSNISSKPVKDALTQLQRALTRAIDRHMDRTALVYAVAAQARANNGWLLELLRAFWVSVDFVFDVLGQLIDISSNLFFTLTGSSTVASDATKLNQVWNGLKDAKSVLGNASFVASLIGFFQSIDDFNLFRTVTDKVSVETERLYKRSGLLKAQSFVKRVLLGKDKTFPSPLSIPERSGPRAGGNRHETFVWVTGATAVIDDINRKFNALIKEIPAKLPSNFPMQEIVDYVNDLRSKVLVSEANVVGIHFFASQDALTLDRRGIAVGSVVSDLNQSNLLSDAILSRQDVHYQEAWDQTIDIGLGILKLHFSQVDFGGKGYQTVKAVEDTIGYLKLATLPEPFIKLFDENVNPLDAINQLTMQMTWDLTSEIARLWAFADGVAGVPDKTTPGKINGGFVRYLIKGGSFPSS